MHWIIPFHEIPEQYYATAYIYNNDNNLCDLISPTDFKMTWSSAYPIHAEFFVFVYKYIYYSLL